MNLRSISLSLCVFVFCFISNALFSTIIYAQTGLTLSQDQLYWKIQSDGSIYWTIDKRLPHQDHIEMSGEKVSVWVEYGVDSLRNFTISRTVIFPTFRTKPNDTHSSAMYTFKDADLPRFFIDGRPLMASLINGRFLRQLNQQAVGVRLKGTIELESEIKNPSLQLNRSIYPSVDKALALETFSFKNTGDKVVRIEMEQLQKEIIVDTTRSYKVPFRFLLRSEGKRVAVLQPGDLVSFTISLQALRLYDLIPVCNAAEEKEKRTLRIKSLLSQMQLETPDTTINTAFSFAKIRATESIFKTKGGYMHGPGGLAYYAAIWANDQAEYINPFFGFLNDPVAHASVMNSYRWFATYMNAEFKPIPSSIVAEGDSFWNGAGDRGDQAMIAYGASRYALTCGRVDSARVLWPLIQWCLEFLEKKKTVDGVYASDSDELEGRFPAGKANLSTSVLAYGALLRAADLAVAIGDRRYQKIYSERAAALRKSIDIYFGGNVQGFNTYRYYDGNDKLRSWICLPLVMGIFDRKEETMKALFSPLLWTKDGILTEAGSVTFWDRSTLYAFRGLFNAGATDIAMPYFHYYSQRRLLGDHVPYPVEAWPEGNQRHLSAESGLYCRAVIEGLFGVEPTGFNSFSFTPRLPNTWNFMRLKNVFVFQRLMDISVQRTGNSMLVMVTSSGKEIFRKNWDGKSRLNVRLPE